MIKTIEGYPVGIFSLSESDLKELQDYYLEDILNYSESTEEEVMPAYKISVKKYGTEAPEGFFDKYHEVIQKYVDEYLAHYKFEFGVDMEFIESWYNVHNKYDHQCVHDHLSNDMPAFACNLILKQPNKDSGQLVFMTPNISNHLKYMKLDPMDVWLNEYHPEMKDGEFFIFPSCVQHYVHYNKTDESRVVMVTNLKVERKVFKK